MKIDEQESFLNYTEETSLKDVILSIKDWYKFITSKWRIILVAAVIGGSIGLAYAYFKKPLYVAELNFALQGDKSGGGLSGALGLASQFGVDVGGGAAGDEFSGDNLVELMKSRAMIESALLTSITLKNKKETLADFYIDFNGLRNKWKETELENIHFLPGVDRANFTLKQDSVLQVFQADILEKSLYVDKLDKLLSIVNVKVTTKNEVFSKFFAEALEKTVSDYYIQTKTEREIKNVSVLQHQTDSVRRALNAAISGVAVSTQANPNPNASRITLNVPSMHKQVDVQANTIILSELVKNLEVTKMSLLEEIPIIHIIDKPIFPLKKQKIGSLVGLFVGVIISVLLAIIALVVTRRYKTIMADNAAR
jgi:uncharacterized protein involved in exopolysaccharide biosynthesis